MQVYPASAHKLETQRQIFQLAQEAMQTKQLKLFKNYQKQLTDYPLQGYLQYLYLRQYLQHVAHKTIEEFLQQEKDTFYARRLHQAWLKQLAKEKNWRQFIRFYQAGSSAELSCYHLQALIATGLQQQAFKEITPLWLVPYSQHEACDPAFKYWQQQGLLNDKLRWQRIMLALRNNQFSLASYLAKSTATAEQIQAWIDRWQIMHESPQKLLKHLPAKSPPTRKVSLARDSDLSREIILHGISRLARQNTEQAFQSWLKLKDHYRFSEAQQRWVRRQIGTQAALKHETKALQYFGDTAGGEWQVRAALWQQNWPVVQQLIVDLPARKKSKTQWQYWLGRAQAETGEQNLARKTFSKLLNRRNYYAFLAADQLGQRYQMNHRPVTASQAELDKLEQEPSIRRLREFYVQDMMLEANREAYQQKRKRNSRELQLLSLITHKWGWHDMTIAFLGSAKYWDALDLRFPLIFNQQMLEAGEKTGLDPSWLTAIARQESLFNSKARSHAGAIGLMQIMPRTGMLISKLVSKPLKHVDELYRSELSIEFGSAYLRKLYDENQQNPVLATASYNAGPHRVARWLPDKTLPADIWTENIRFNETRKYVKKVLSYAAIFDRQRKLQIIPLTDRMPEVHPKKP